MKALLLVGCFWLVGCVTTQPESVEQNTQLIMDSITLGIGLLSQIKNNKKKPHKKPKKPLQCYPEHINFKLDRITHSYEIATIKQENFDLIRRLKKLEFKLNKRCLSYITDSINYWKSTPLAINPYMKLDRQKEIQDLKNLLDLSMDCPRKVDSC